MEENILTDKEKIEDWVELVEFNNFYTNGVGHPLPGEFRIAVDRTLAIDKVSFTEAGAVVCSPEQKATKTIIFDKELAKEFIATAQRVFLLFIYIDMTTNIVTCSDVEAMYTIWIRFLNRFSDEFDYDVPEKLIPNFIRNDTFGMLEKVTKEL